MFCPGKLKNFNEAIFFKFRRFVRGFGLCFGTDAFDTDTFQRAILYQKEGYLILYPVI